MTRTALHEDAQKLICEANEYVTKRTGSLRQRKALISLLRVVEHQVDDPEEMSVVTDMLIRDTDRRFGTGQMEAFAMSSRAQPTERGWRNSRQHFETLVQELTHCTVGDGTLAMDNERQYLDPLTQSMWARYSMS